MGLFLFHRRSVVHPTIGLAGLSFADDPAAIVVPSDLPTIAAVASPTTDLRRVYSTGILNQGPEDDCVWFAKREANDFVNRGAGAQLSERGGWTSTRALETVVPGAPLTNIGCQTTDAYSVSISTGWRPRDAADDDPSQANTRENVDELVARIKVPARCFVPLADGDLDSLHRWATAECPATFTVWVGPKFQACGAQNPVWTGETSQDSSTGGYHRLSYRGNTMIGGVSHEIALNHWGTDSGEGGYVYIPSTDFPKLAIEAVVHRGGIRL